MNAKELRQAAEAVKIDAEISLKEELWSLPASYKTIGAFTVKLMDHILSTVRDDDDEPVTYEWLSSIKKPYMANRKIWWNLDGYTVSISSSCARFHCNHMPFASVQTRGQFRSLCRGLGIELKENGCV